MHPCQTVLIKQLLQINRKWINLVVYGLILTDIHAKFTQILISSILHLRIVPEIESNYRIQVLNLLVVAEFINGSDECLRVQYNDSSSDNSAI